jgi:nucleoside-diphosphate-sugar epimerase
MENRETVLITGSEGLIGDAVVRRLYRNYDVASFDINRPSKDPKEQDFIPCDLTQQDSVDEALKTLKRRHGSRIASVVHLAAYYDFSGEPSPMYRDLTYDGTRRLIRGLQQGFEVDQFLYSSTILVVSPSEDDKPVDEKAETAPAWSYPRWKLATEELIRRIRGPMKSVFLRIAGVYDEDCHSIPLAQQIARIYEEKMESYFFPGDPDKGQAFVHVQDLVDCIEKTIERRAELNDTEIFVVGEPELMSYGELQDTIGELIHNERWWTIRIPKAVAKAGAWAMDAMGGETFIKPWMIDLADQHYPLEIGKAKEKLGWAPEHRLRFTLPHITGRLLTDPHRWYEENNLEAPEEEAKSKKK